MWNFKLVLIWPTGKGRVILDKTIRLVPGTSFLGHESSWVRVVLGTSHLGYGLSWVRAVLGTSRLGFELAWARIVLGTNCLGYELSWVRIVHNPSEVPLLYAINTGINPEALNGGMTTMTTRCATACSQTLPVKRQGGLGQRYWSVSGVTWLPKTGVSEVGVFRALQPNDRVELTWGNVVWDILALLYGTSFLVQTSIQTSVSLSSLES